MRICRLVPLLWIPFLLGGCSSISVVSEQFESASREYNRMLRWNERENACLMYSGTKMKDECLARVQAVKGVEIADYRVRSTELDAEKGEAVVRVEIDYYIPPSTRLKTLEDLQEWRLNEGEVASKWRIMTLMPQFR